jgi:hypothetical protein
MQERLAYIILVLYTLTLSKLANCVSCLTQYGRWNFVLDTGQCHTEGEGLVGLNPPKFQSFDKAEPNSQFRGKYIRNNLIRIQVSSFTDPHSLCPLSSTEFVEHPLPPPKKNSGYATDMGGVYQIWYSNHYFILILVMYILSTTLHCQLFDLLLSLKLKSCMLETNSHYTPELLICAPGDLTMSNLTYKANFLQCECPTLFGQYRNVIYLFVFCLGSKFAHVTVWILHVAPAFHVLAKQIIISSVSCSQGFWLKELYPSLKASWMDLYFFFLNERFIAPINIRTYIWQLQNCSVNTTNLQQCPNNYIYECDSTKMLQQWKLVRNTQKTLRVIPGTHFC